MDLHAREHDRQVWLLSIVLDFARDVLAEHETPLVLVVADLVDGVCLGGKRVSLVGESSWGGRLGGECKLVHHTVQVLLSYLGLVFDLLRFGTELFELRLEPHLLRFKFLVSRRYSIVLLHELHEIALRAVRELSLIHI